MYMVYYTCLNYKPRRMYTMCIFVHTVHMAYWYIYKNSLIHVIRSEYTISLSYHIYALILLYILSVYSYMCTNSKRPKPENIVLPQTIHIICYPCHTYILKIRLFQPCNALTITNIKQ